MLRINALFSMIILIFLIFLIYEHKKLSLEEYKFELKQLKKQILVMNIDKNVTKYYKAKIESYIKVAGMVSFLEMIIYIYLLKKNNILIKEEINPFLDDKYYKSNKKVFEKIDVMLNSYSVKYLFKTSFLFMIYSLYSYIKSILKANRINISENKIQKYYPLFIKG